ncbi:YqhA family protein (plasmid) [Pseudonocardia broussonetiae]|uniref:YqhA family protein n=2 Tax=Pseudonocardia broussonetiae TaxID=2736640 RepID=A0A6M6JV69_9PSEU|nr:YqhA family protein [Pseudonocardia broussonetiae]
MRWMLERLRLLIVVAVVGLTLTTVVTLGWGVARAVALVGVLVSGGWLEDATLVGLLEVIDLFLVATVQLIVVLGLYELFVGDLDLPDWLTVCNLGELKQPIVDVLVVLMVIKFIERALTVPPLDALYYGLAYAVVIGALVAFTAVSKRVRAPGAGPSERR